GASRRASASGRFAWAANSAAAASAAASMRAFADAAGDVVLAASRSSFDGASASRGCRAGAEGAGANPAKPAAGAAAGGISTAGTGPGAPPGLSVVKVAGAGRPRRGSGTAIHSTSAAAATIGTSHAIVDLRHTGRGKAGGALLTIAATSA